MGKHVVQWNWNLLRKIAEASGKNVDGLRRTITRLADDLQIELPKRKERK